MTFGTMTVVNASSIMANGGNSMHPVLRLETTVLPGHRLEVQTPELPDGAKVIVVLPARSGTRRMSMVEFLKTLPASQSPRCFPTWEEYEQHLQKEKDAWE
jgi:hypothetical protein